MKVESIPRFLCLLALVLCAAACSRSPKQPQLLVQADSAFVAADYVLADSLLAAFDSLSLAATSPSDSRPQLSDGHYRLLLDLEQKFVRDDLTEADFSAADSLVRYYNNKGTREEQARALIFLGDAYSIAGDNPSALNCYLEAEHIGQQTGSIILQVWTAQSIGDEYFDQRMLDDCKKYYRRQFHLSVSSRDTLRMAHAHQRMGRVYTIENNVDSALFCYQQAQILGDILNRSDFVDISKSLLADIYIQIDEFEKAKKLMSYDQLNDENWAYWHLGQHHLDSASFYFKQMLGLYGPYAQTEYLRKLAQLEEQRGNLLQALSFYSQYANAEDSLKVQSRVEDTRRVNAQYNYNTIKDERDKLARFLRYRTSMALLCGFVMFVLIVVLIYFNRRLKVQKELHATRARLLDKEKKSILKDTELAKLKSYEIQNDLKERLILTEQKLENAKKEQKKLKIEEFRSSRLFQLLNHQKTDEPYKLSTHDWKLLAETVDGIYEHFTNRILSIAPLTFNELCICYLIKMNIPVSDIALLLNKTPSAISHARSRMCIKLLKKSGSADEMDDFLRKL